MSQIFIGWSGRARHGKTECTLAVKEFVESFGKTVGVYDVGAMILQLCIKEGLLPQIKREDMNKEQVQVLVNVGNKMRQLDNQYWTKRVVAAAKEEQRDVAMCPNVRFQQEATAIKNMGGAIVRCTRLNEDGSLYISPDRDPNDTTETAMSFWPADFYLTHVNSPSGSQFIKAQAITLYKYLAGYTL